MRLFFFLLAPLFICLSCVKPKSKDPVPVITFDDFKAWRVSGHDTAVMVISYEDGDGDIFRDRNENGPNLIATFYYLNSATQKFTGIKDIITNDTARITQTILQPSVIYEDVTTYKGKSVKGQMYLPWAPFRSGDSVKVFKYTLFIVDEAGNKSNVMTTPTFTVDF